ncbi:hypothetical protein SDC9_194398 [bioreactor metagenome]|uniref:Uncharacterized protein n=1 Tax=bioreactor metagenome TaxID=1076179 RepID=A0A645I8R6_9ZZZZ
MGIFCEIISNKYRYKALDIPERFYDIDFVYEKLNIIYVRTFPNTYVSYPKPGIVIFSVRYIIYVRGSGE